MNYPMTSFMANFTFPHRHLRLWVLMGWILALAQVLCAQSDAPFPPKPDPAVYVHDYAGWLSASERDQLEQKLIGYFRATSTQIVVMVRPDIGDYDRATYAFELGDRWGIGRKSKDNGIVILVKTVAPDRGIFIATGRGTEGALPDGRLGTIIRQHISPKFREQRYYEGLNAGIDQITAALKGEFKSDPSDVGHEASVWEVLLVAFLVLSVMFFFFYMVAKRAKKMGDWYTTNGGPMTRQMRHPRSRRDPWGGGGGGWIIGGGPWMGGGGGGSDSGWGGGDGGSFGGGSFGGGGAGGDW
jgi:uncharacterized protein